MKSQNDSIVALPWGNEVLNPVRNTNQTYLKFVNTLVFSEDGRRFLRYGYYTDAPKGTLDYDKYWEEQERRCLNGYTVGGVRITGRQYFFLNFCPIKARPIDPVTGLESIKAQKKWTLPRFLDHSYYFFHELEECLAEGPHVGKDKKGMVILKSRRKGFTYQISGGVYAYNFQFMPHSMNMLAAFEKTHYKVTLDGIHNALNHINKNTPWIRRREVLNQRDHFRASFKEKNAQNVEVEDGYLSEIHAISFKDNPFKSIGESLDIAGFEEAGKFTGLLEALAITEPTYRDGDIMTGVPLVWGCVCAGTKVWTNDGRKVNIEDLQKEDGIIGYAGTGAMQQSIIWQKPVGIKPCYRITTSKGNYIECSHDHPLLWSKLQHNTKVGGVKRKVVEFKYAEDIRVGDQLMAVRQMPVFGKERMLSPRVVGLLIGDDSYGSNSKVELAVGDEEVYIWLKEQGVHTHVLKEFNQKDGKVYRSLGINNIHPYLRELGILGQTREMKHLPKDIHKYDLYSITELLGGYFDADGSVYYSKKKKSIRITLTSKHKHLLEEVRDLLFKLGISCNIVKEYRKGGFKEGVIYRLYIAKKEDIREFYKHIKLLCKHKQDRISAYVDNIASDSVHNNCKFRYNETNKKGFYLSTVPACDNLESLYVTKVEFIGEKEIYNLNADITHTYISNGFISGNTGGDIEAGGVALESFFYHPEAYGFKAYNNIYDDNATGECGWFVDDLWYLPGKTLIDGKEQDMLDSQGNSIRNVAYEGLMRKRDEKKKGDPRAYKTFITQQPLTPKEALMRTDGDFFDVISAQDRLSQIETNPGIYLNTIFIGKLHINDNNKIDWRPSEDLPVREFPIRDNKNKPGAIEIFEHPVRNERGEIPAGLYIAGIDPYDDDESTTDSLGSTLIMNIATDRIVAEYTGRPATAYQYYENVRRLLMYYNALAMYENAKKGLFAYFERMNSTYLLADTPKFLKDMELVKGGGTGNSSKGYYPSQQVNAFGRGLIRNWSQQLAHGHDDGVTNMLVIRSWGLLKELANYNSKGNFDRVSAAIALMLLREEKARYLTPGLMEQKQNLKREDKFFSRNYGNKNPYGGILFGNRH